MNDASFDPNVQALSLASAWRSGAALNQLEERPRTLGEAYAVQAAFVGKVGEGGAGWKLAGASPRGLRGELPNPPAIGVLIPSRVFPSGALVQLPLGRQATLEVEVAFRFSRTVSPGDEAFDASSMIECAMVAIEVVCSRFVDRKAVGQPSFIADNLGFHALVCGDSLGFSDGSEFEEEAALWRNGECIAQSLTRDDRTQPFLSLGFLWNEFARRRSTIAKGSLVTTGTLSVPVDVAQAACYEARIGQASVSFMLAQ